MKNTHILQICICVLSLSVFYSCGNGGDTEIATPLTPDSIPIDTTWRAVPEEYITELLNTEIPPLGLWVGNSELEEKYRHASMLQRHGDIPEVRTIIAYELNTEPGAIIGANNIDKFIIYLEANMSISPSEETQKALESAKKTKEQLNVDLNKLLTEDPELYVRMFHDMLIEEFGDIPEVHTYTKTLRKILLKQVIPEEELEAYEKAVRFLFENQA